VPNAARSAQGRRYKVYSLSVVFSFIITALLVAQNPSLALQRVAQDVIAQRLQRLHANDSDREMELKTMFGEAGCPGDQVQEETVKRKDPPNLICTPPGSANSIIVVGAHFDHADAIQTSCSWALMLPRCICLSQNPTQIE
jgi:hypothetical protein